MKNAFPYTPPSVKYKQRATITLLVAVAFVCTCAYMGFDPSMIFTEFHYVSDLAASMMPPDFSMLWMDRSILVSVEETLSMGFLGTVFGATLALVFAMLATADTMPYMWVRLPVRIFLSAVRVVPSLIWVIIFVVTVGLGAFAGMLTLIIYTIGNFGQLFMEVIAATEKPPAEAIYSTGATRWQVIRYAIFPQILPSLVANFFYAFDVNVRSAISLGIFGGGGVGFQLFLAMRTLHYRDAFALICLTVVLIVLMEKLSDFLRKRLLGKGLLK